MRSILFPACLPAACLPACLSPHFRASLHHVHRAKTDSHSANTVKAIAIIGPAVIKAGVLSPLEFYHIVLAIAGNLDNTLPSFPALDTPEKVHDVILASRLAWQESFPEVYYVSIAFGGVAIVASCFLPNLRKFMDGHVAVQYH